MLIISVVDWLFRVVATPIHLAYALAPILLILIFDETGCHVERH